MKVIMNAVLFCGFFFLPSIHTQRIACLLDCPNGMVPGECKCNPLSPLNTERIACLLDCPNGFVLGECKCKNDIGIQMMPSNPPCSLQCDYGVIQGECKCAPPPTPPFQSGQFFATPCSYRRCNTYQSCRVIGGRGICVLALMPGLGTWSSRQSSNTDVAVDKCEEPKVSGRCRGFYPRYHYDMNTKRCSRFIYGGCQGNRNNFRTLRECLSSCRKYIIS